MIEAGDPSVEELLEETRNMQVGLNITPDYKFFILFNGIFNSKRNIVKNWSKYEMVFLKLVKEAGDNGIKRLWQTIVIFFMVSNKDQQKFLPTFAKLLYDQSVFSDEFMIGWHGSKVKLDKHCILYDRKAEKACRPLLDEFIEWLQSDDYGEEEGYGEEGAEGEAAEEFKMEEEAPKKKEETDAERAQRELIEAQMKAQTQNLAANKVAAETAAEEEEKKAETIEGATDIAKIEVEDNFDIDDI